MTNDKNMKAIFDVNFDFFLLENIRPLPEKQSLT